VALSSTDSIDLFIHDSDDRVDHELRELELVASHLSAVGIVLSDNAHVTSTLAEWNLKHNRLFCSLPRGPQSPVSRY